MAKFDQISLICQVPTSSTKFRTSSINLHQVPSSSANFRQVPSRSVKFRQVPSNFNKFHQVLSNSIKFRNVLPSFFQFRQFLQVPASSLNSVKLVPGFRGRSGFPGFRVLSGQAAQIEAFPRIPRSVGPGSTDRSFSPDSAVGRARQLRSKLFPGFRGRSGQTTPIEV